MLAVVEHQQHLALAKVANQLIGQRPGRVFLNAEDGSHIVVEGAEHSEVSRSPAPQQVVRRHGSAKPLV